MQTQKEKITAATLELAKFNNFEHFRKQLEKKGYAPGQIDLLEKEKTNFSINNITKHKNGSVEFDLISDFFLIEQIKLAKIEIPIWDCMISLFTSPKNAANTLQYCLENNYQLTYRLIDDQKSLMPKDGAIKAKTYYYYLASLNEIDRAKLATLCNSFHEKHFRGLNSFDSFAINGQNNLNFNEGDFVELFDATRMEVGFAVVLQANKNSFISILGAAGLGTLTNYAAPKLLNKNQIPKDILIDTIEGYNMIIEEQEMAKEAAFYKFCTFLEKQTKIKSDLAAKNAKDLLAKENLAKLEFEHNALIEEFNSIKFENLEQINFMLSKLNAAKLPKETADIFKATLKLETARLKELDKATKKAKKETLETLETLETAPAAPKTKKAKKETTTAI